MDDVLDYDGDEGETGKHLGDDLAEGKPTLPLIIAMQRGDQHEVSLIRQAIEQQNRNDLEKIRKTIESTGALVYTRALAKEEARKGIDALNAIPASKYRDALAALAHVAANRNS